MTTRVSERASGSSRESPPCTVALPATASAGQSKVAPLQVPAKWLDDYASIGDKDRRTYAAMVAAMDAGVDAFILERLAAAPDHAATLFFPEGDYLKGLVLRRR